jgi:hypothetical protein
VKWFKHDTDAHNDAKLDKVLMHYGSHGYAVYFYCLELIAGKIDKGNTSCALEHDAEQIGARLKIDSVEVSAILQYLVDVGLFDGAIESSITCLKLLGRLDKSMTNSPQLRQIIGTHRQETSADVMTLSDMSANVTPDKNRTEEKRTKPSERQDSVAEQFELFWAKYPRKEGKKQALDHFRRLNASNRTACLADDVVRRFKDRERKYIPAGDQYVKRQLWQDEINPGGKREILI